LTRVVPKILKSLRLLTNISITRSIVYLGPPSQGRHVRRNAFPGQVDGDHHARDRRGCRSPDNAPSIAVCSSTSQAAEAVISASPPSHRITSATKDSVRPPESLRCRAGALPSPAPSTGWDDSRSSRTTDATHSPSSPPYREVCRISRPRARVRLLGLPLVQSHPPVRFHQRCL
jgi:hypothetical protein